MFSLIIFFIFVLVGILTALKYPKAKKLEYSEFKSETFVWWGIGLLGMGFPWAGSGISFLMIIITGEGLSPAPYFFISMTWMAITLFFWMWTMTELMAKEKQKIILGTYAVIGIMFDSYFIYRLITNPSAIGTLHTPPIDSTYIGLTLLFTLFVLASISISLYILIGKNLKSDNPKVKLKAYFLLVAMTSFIFGAYVDAFMELTIITIFIIRIILISSAIEFYIGWILPAPIKKLFLKEE